MTIAAQNFDMVKGNDVDVAIIVKDLAGNVKDITDATVKFAMAVDRQSTPVLTKATPTGITLSDPVNGEFTIHFDPADTTNLAEGMYVFEAETTDQSGNIVAVTLGRILLYNSII